MKRAAILAPGKMRVPKGRVQLGSLFVMHALVGGLAAALGAKAPRTAKVAGRKTQADIDAIDRAESKRARKAAKLREHGL